MRQKKCDVLIIGAGMGGSLLARQLKIQMPDLKIINIEGRKKFDYWIGESTVEVWTDYAYRICNLGAYLHKHQMVKHGLRFYFDTEKKDLPMTQMSESGRTAYAGFPRDIYSHQLDRASFDRDMCQMNSDSGIEVLMGTRVTEGADGKPDIQIDREKGHLVQTTAGPIRCKWLVDAGGRTAPLANKLGLTAPEPRHSVGSYWGRFEGFKDIDELHDPAWKKRINHTLRYLSTNHFMYKGYWIWMIPVSDKIISLGVSFHKEMSPLKMKNGEELLKFLRQHKCFRELLPETTKTLDFMGFAECARHAKQFYSDDRWFLTGMSGFVLDALFSTTGITTSYSNRCIGEMIKTDRMGEEKLFKRQVKHFNMFMQTEYERYLLTMQRYREFACYEAWQGWRPASYFYYLNTAVTASTEDFRTLFATVRLHGDNCGCTLERSIEEFRKSYLVTISRLNMEFVDFLDERGKYYEANQGQFVDTSPRLSLVEKFYERREKDREDLETRMLYETLYRYFLGRMAHHEGIAWNEAAFTGFFDSCHQSGQTLAMGLKALKAAKPSRTPQADNGVIWTPRGPVDLDGQEISPTKLYGSRKTPKHQTLAPTSSRR